MHLLRAGIDSLYFAVRGSLPLRVITQLADAKRKAIETRCEADITFAGTDLRADVSFSGQTGGYQFVFDTGPLGARFAIKESSETLDWNLFVKPHASAFLGLGFKAAIKSALKTIEQIGGRIAEVSVNRVDYAMDIRADGTELDLSRIIAHPRTKRAPHWERSEQFQPSAILTGRRIESITVGRMPGRQVIVYDKTVEARTSQHLYWFEAWKIDPNDRGARVWRVELRLGRHALKTMLKMKTLKELELHLPQALCDLLQRIRYTAAGESDPNVTRRRRDPLWVIAGGHVQSADLLGGIGDLAPERLMEITREQMSGSYTKLIVGNAAGFAATRRFDDVAIRETLSEQVAIEIDRAIQTDSFHRSMKRARARVALLFPDQPSPT